MKIKICGLKSLSDIDYVNQAKPDYAGFIFARESKRKIDVKTATEMKKFLSSDIKSVGVFVNSEIPFIKSLCEAGIIDLIQLHGNENEEYIKELKNEVDNKIIKAYPADVNLVSNIENTRADYVLVDSVKDGQFGGTGVAVNLNFIPETDKKVFLAGGINSDNVINMIKKINPYCVDINSGVETDGKKDKTKILEIVKTIRDFECKNKENNND